MISTWECRMRMLYEKVVWESCMRMLNENVDILKLWDDVQMFKYKTIQILVIFLTLTNDWHT